MFTAETIANNMTACTSFPSGMFQAEDLVKVCLITTTTRRVIVQWTMSTKWCEFTHFLFEVNHLQLVLVHERSEHCASVIKDHTVIV
jgi:hypothetical protein